MPVLILPGLNDSEPPHWQSLWQAEIPDAYRVRQDDWARPECQRWLARLVGEVERNPGAILVGHSLGATLIAHLARSHPLLPVGGALLVAPADPDLNGARALGVASFAPLPLTPFPFPAIVVASRTDPYMGQDRARVIAKLWEAEFVDAGEAGHINVASGHGAWPEGRPLLERLRAPRGYLRPALKAATAMRPSGFAETTGATAGAGAA